MAHSFSTSFRSWLSIHDAFYSISGAIGTQNLVLIILVLSNQGVCFNEESDRMFKNMAWDGIWNDLEMQRKNENNVSKECILR